MTKTIAIIIALIGTITIAAGDPVERERREYRERQLLHRLEPSPVEREQRAYRERQERHRYQREPSPIERERREYRERQRRQ